MSETTKKPRTPAQAAASRRNGSKSNGPKTTEGKARAAANAIKHGLTAQYRFALNQEDAKLFNEFHEQYTRAYMPANQAEAALVLEIARCAWRLERIAGIEVSLFDIKVNDQWERVVENYGPLTKQERVALAFTSLTVQTNQLNVLSRYESTCRRGLLAATSTLARLQADRLRREQRHSAPSAQLPTHPKLRNEPEPSENVVPMLPQRFDLFDPSDARVPLGFPNLPVPGDRRNG